MEMTVRMLVEPFGPDPAVVAVGGSAASTDEEASR